MFHNLNVLMNTCINYCCIKLVLNEDRRLKKRKQNTFENLTLYFIREKPVVLTVYCFAQPVPERLEHNSIRNTPINRD